MKFFIPPFHHQLEPFRRWHGGLATCNLELQFVVLVAERIAGSRPGHQREKLALLGIQTSLSCHAKFVSCFDIFCPCLKSGTVKCAEIREISRWHVASE